MRRGRPSARRQLTRDRVLLAAYLLADAQGLLCPAGKAAIARRAGVGVETAGWYFRQLAREGVPGGGALVQPGRSSLVE